jgi:hypothetical protein
MPEQSPADVPVGLNLPSRLTKIQDDTYFRILHIILQGIASKVALTSRFLKRKMQEYGALKGEIEALEAEVSTHSMEVIGSSIPSTPGHQTAV